MASFVFLSGKCTVDQIAAHPAYRDLASMLLYECPAGHSGLITRHVHSAYDPKLPYHDIAKKVRRDLHVLVDAQLLARWQLHLPPPMIGEKPIAVFDRATLEHCDKADPLHNCQPSAEEILTAAQARVPGLAALRTFNVYSTTKFTRKILTRYGDPQRRLSVEFGELLSFGISEFFVAEELTSEMMRGPGATKDLIEDYKQLSEKSTDVAQLASHEFIVCLSFAELVFRLRQSGTDQLKDLIRNVRFRFAGPRLSRKELEGFFVEHLESKLERERLEIW